MKKEEMTAERARRLSHESMKRASDFVGALVRLGLLTALITYLFDRTSDYSDWSGYWVSLNIFAIFLCLVWIVLANRILNFFMAVVLSHSENLIEDYVSGFKKIEEKHNQPTQGGWFSKGLSEMSFGLRIVSRSYAGILLLLLFLFVLINISVAAFFEIALFLK